MLHTDIISPYPDHQTVPNFIVCVLSSLLSFVTSCSKLKSQDIIHEVPWCLVVSQNKALKEVQVVGILERNDSKQSSASNVNI